MHLKSKLISGFSITVAIVTGLIGVALFCANQYVGTGKAANWDQYLGFGVLFLIAYGCLIGPVLVCFAIVFFKSGREYSDDLYAQEVRAERQRKAELAERNAEKLARAEKDEAFYEAVTVAEQIDRNREWQQLFEQFHKDGF